MAEGFLKGIWGKPAQSGTGIMGLWSTVKSAPSSIYSAITTPIKLVKWVVIIGLTILLYSRFKK